MSQPFLFFGRECFGPSALLVDGKEGDADRSLLHSPFQQEVWISLFTIRSHWRPAWLSPLCYTSWAVQLRRRCKRSEITTNCGMSEHIEAKRDRGCAILGGRGRRWTIVEANAFPTPSEKLDHVVVTQGGDPSVYEAFQGTSAPFEDQHRT
jgi:hypothetical protein